MHNVEVDLQDSCFPAFSSRLLVLLMLTEVSDSCCGHNHHHISLLLWVENSEEIQGQAMNSFLTLPLSVLSLRNQNWATRALWATAPPNRNERLAGRSRSSKSCPARNFSQQMGPVGCHTENFPRNLSSGWHGWKANQLLRLLC